MADGDVALLDTLDGWTVHVPGHGEEAERLLRAAAATDDRVYVRLSTQHNDRPYHGGGRLRTIHRGGRDAPVIVAVGPMLDPVLEATLGLDVTVVYTNTPRPLDTAGLRSAMHGDAIVVVEPYAKGTSAHLVSEALSGLPHRSLYLGAGRAEVRRYGSRQGGFRYIVIDFQLCIRQAFHLWHSRLLF